MNLGVISLLIANFIGGAFSPLFVKLGVQEIPPLTFTAFRFILATILILPFFWARKSKLSFSRLVILNSIFFAANMGIFSIGIQYTTAIMSPIMYSFAPLMVGLLEFIFLGQKPTKNKILGTLLAIAGLFFLLSQSFSASNSSSFGTPFGNILVFLAVFFWSAYLFISRKMQEDSDILGISLANFTVAAVILGLLIPVELSVRPFSPTAMTSVGFTSLLGAGFFSSVLYIFFLQTGIRILGPFVASLFNYTAPFFGALTAVPLLGEKITPELVVGGFLVLAGTFYATSYPLWTSKN